MVKIIITSNEADQRLDRFLKKYLKKAPLSAIYKMIRKDVKINGKRGKEDTQLREGDEIALYISEEKLAELTAPVKKKAAKRQFKIAYEDENVLIVDKPSGLLTHGDAHEKKNTLVNQVCGYLQEKGEYEPSRERTFVPAPVNRLDRNTTGLVIFGKNAAALRSLTAVLRERDHVEKYYQTIVCGKFEKELVLEDRLVKDHDKNISSVTEDGKEARTQARPLVTGEKFSLAEVRIFTGRTHQIRVHMANAGYPLAGDIKYGNRKANELLKKHGVTTQLLHAYKLKFTHMPEELAGLEGKVVEAPLPADFARVKEVLIAEKGLKG
ncbi:MAG: RluA family pseudouridine synthase [Bacillota bacterium]|nr:RluA family pseudouridine synthase [Bacillota bacterium]